jgi:hypothetical protein
MIEDLPFVTENSRNPRLCIMIVPPLLLFSPTGSSRVVWHTTVRVVGERNGGSGGSVRG